MKNYEIVCTYLNGCSGSAYPLTSFEEAALFDTDDYIRQKHGKYFDKFEKEIRDNGQVIYTYDNGTVTYIYEFSQL